MAMTINPRGRQGHGYQGSIHQGDVLEALFLHLKKTVEDVPFFQCVPFDSKPPYGVMQVASMHPGNGLPFPHFYTEGVVTLQVWSAYQGVRPLTDIMHRVSDVLTQTPLACGLGVLTFQAGALEVPTQLMTAQKKWREGRLTLPFHFQHKKEEK